MARMIPDLDVVNKHLRTNYKKFNGGWIIKGRWYSPDFAQQIAREQLEDKFPEKYKSR